MKRKGIALIFTVMLLFAMVTAANAAAHPFEDVPDGTWYAKYVDYVYINELMNGTSSTRFQPQTTMSRAMAVTVLHRLAGKPESSESNPFTDAPSGNWYSDAVLWAVENKITNGTSASTFAPEKSVTREQLVTFLYRYAKTQHLELTQGNLSRFDDYAQISSFARTAFAWAVAQGIITGTDDTHLSPMKSTSRAECATILTRFDQWYRDQTAPDIPPHIHNYVVEVVKPTCTQSGYTTYTCACGSSFRGDQLEAKGHTYREEVIAPTFDAQGYTEHICNSCGHSYRDNYQEKLPPVPDPISYEAYRDLSAEEKKAYMNAFADVDDFFEWYYAALEQYKKEHPDIEIGGGDIDIGDIIGGN